MGDVRWDLLANMPNAGVAFNQAFTAGQEQGRQNKARAAMAALVKDPNNVGALQALADADPATAMQFQQQRAEMLKQHLAEHTDNILKGAEIIRQINPTDQASYSRALAIAQQAGIDVSEVPPQYNPDYVKGIVSLADAMKPQPNGDPNQVVVTPQPGMPAFVYDKRAHTAHMLFAPNPGNEAPGAPVGTPTATDAHGNKVQFNSQTGQWEPIGGQTPPASGGFR